MSDAGERLKQDYRKVFSTPEGKNVLRDLSRRCNVMVSITGKCPEPHTISYTEGMRNVFWYVFGQVHDPPSTVARTAKGFEPVVDSFTDLRRPVT